ncbi:hypothetical protein SD427_07320 [Chryseobacterium sp. JJR-5R]|uniref:hypothetical protein n=1 Tax=Chryseobacterium sp. JJR-5R TaxID=3093923 RepID=UPI002A7590F9|nr:hypothetical protein [Chryseobacterium sp. JJR-5R]WPO84136.1 hypothetical protein SD427_07320 [Chryseobacterium sp. JJR-5R]
MKKNSIDLESRFWSGRKKHSPVPLLEVFFQFHDLVTAKERLNRIMQYASQKKTRIPEDPSVVFHFHQSLRSFLRAGWCLRKKPGKWTVDILPEPGSPLVQGSLSEEEYRDAARVFRKAFKEYRLEEFEEFLSDIVYFSLGNFNHVPERDIIGLCLHLAKMLDAAWLILERKDHKKKFTQAKPAVSALQSP